MYTFHLQEEEGGDHLSIKILIPSSAVGAIIGKGGEAMRNLKNDNNCRVQMSKNSETYPGEYLSERNECWRASDAFTNILTALWRSIAALFYGFRTSGHIFPFQARPKESVL